LFPNPNWVVKFEILNLFCKLAGTVNVDELLIVIKVNVFGQNSLSDKKVAS
jgi:hypothetical protein